MKEPTGAHLVLDEQLCKSKIEAMASKAKANECVFRPHFKTHDNLIVGRWYREAGVEKITVSSMTMAQKFADDGWKDIFVAVPVNQNEADWINRLTTRISLTVLVEDSSSVAFLAEHVFQKINVRVEVDAGYHRTGIKWNDQQELTTCVEALNKAHKLNFTGFSLHAGNSYSCKGKFQIQDVHEHYATVCGRLAEQFSCEISVGDTPTCSVCKDFGWANEMRPGNFVFYDLMQCSIGTCNPDHISAWVRCPIVAVYPDRNEVVVHAGGVHFSKEKMLWEGQPCYGLLATSGRKGIVLSLSQEHGILKVDEGQIDEFKRGDFIDVIPVHSCLAANLLPAYTTNGTSLVD